MGTTRKTTARRGALRRSTPAPRGRAAAANGSERTPVAVIGMEPDGTVSQWNRYAQELFGYRGPEIIGQPATALLGPDNLEELRRLVRALGGGLSIRGYQTTRRTKSGKRIAIRMTIAPVRRRPGGQVTGFVANASPVRPNVAATTDLEACIVESASRMQADLDARERLTGQILAAQDEERRRLGRDLHDSTGQLLAGLSMNLAQLERRHGGGSPEYLELLADSRDLLDRAQRELRTWSYLLHPPMLDEAGLGSAVRWCVAGFAARSGLAATVRIPSRFPRLPQEVELALFRVLQESITNVHRHSRSPSVDVRLRYVAGVASLEVIDCGHGYDRAAEVARGGVGIPGMRERMQRLGGTLAITSSERGTRVLASVACALRDSELKRRAEVR